MTTLSRAIDAADGILSISVGIDFGSLPAPVTIDSENLLVTAGDNARTIHVERGLNGTAAAPHSLGATITQGWGGGSGGVTPTLAEVLTEGDETGEHIINMPLGSVDGRTANAGITALADRNGGGLNLAAGSIGGTVGGGVTLTGGDGTGGAGNVTITAGNSSAVNGGAVGIYGGTSALQAGAGIEVSGGAPADGNGADINLIPGAGDGAGRNGLVFLNLPTSDPHVAGALWNSSTTVKVSAG